jgi:excisionase family DNA binding protein
LAPRPRFPCSSREPQSIAGVCAVALGASNSDSAWVEWLDCLRRESVDFKPGEMSVNAWTENRQPDFEVSARGLLWPPTEILPGSTAEIISIELGEIDDVCRASERVCQRLADEALRTEIHAPLEKPESPDGGAPGGASLSGIGWLFPLGQEASSAPPGSESDPAEVPAAESTSAAVLTPKIEPAGAVSRSSANPDVSRAMTLREAATSLRTSDDTLHRMRLRGEIQMFKVGSRWRVLASEVLRLRRSDRFASR